MLLKGFPIKAAWGSNVCVIFVTCVTSLCFQAFFTEKYLQEHPEDQDKIELLKQQIAIQVWKWEKGIAESWNGLSGEGLKTLNLLGVWNGWGIEL